MVMTASAARTTSSVHGLEYSVEMSMPRSAMASMADGLTSVPGSEPPEDCQDHADVGAELDHVGALPPVTRDDGSNPEVAGSNPAPATG
jgi:hypothetical protein